MIFFFICSWLLFYHGCDFLLQLKVVRTLKTTLFLFRLLYKLPAALLSLKHDKPGMCLDHGLCGIMKEKDKFECETKDVILRFSTLFLLFKILHFIKKCRLFHFVIFYKRFLALFEFFFYLFFALHK